MFDVSIDANSRPTTTNFLTVENLIANILHGKLGISAAVTTDPELSIAKLYVGLGIKIYSASNSAEQDYITPEAYLASEDFILKLQKLDGLVDIIRDNLDSEDPPAYYYDMEFNKFNSGEELG
jgi:hypothetical protein